MSAAFVHLGKAKTKWVEPTIYIYSAMTLLIHADHSDMKQEKNISNFPIDPMRLQENILLAYHISEKSVTEHRSIDE